MRTTPLQSQGHADLGIAGPGTDPAIAESRPRGLWPCRPEAMRTPALQTQGAWRKQVHIARRGWRDPAGARKTAA